MFYNTLHNQKLRLFGGVIGQLIVAISINLFIVPMNLYTGGTIGVCQMIRTLMQTYMGFNFGNHDIASILYFLSNIPILLFAYKNLGRTLLVKTIVCLIAYSVFGSIIPIPTKPIIDDYLTACLLGGILNAIGSGITLTCGCSSGGLETIGVCLSKRGSKFTVGKVSLSFNIVLYTVCFLMFVPEILIYSIIYNFFTYLILDRVHQQNVNVQIMIFTRKNENEFSQYIMNELNRGVTYWAGVGAYSGEEIHILCVCLTKYEIDELLHVVHTIDPHAFLMAKSGVQVFGNFHRKTD